MTKIICNNIEAKNIIKDLPTPPKEGELVVNGRSYQVTHVKNWSTIQLIGRRFLGGLLVAVTFGLGYLDRNSALCKTCSSLFNRLLRKLYFY